MEVKSVIKIKNVIKRFPIGGDFFTALKSVELILNEGEFTGLIGPSGSGKTTLLNIIGGLDAPSDGEISVLENNLQVRQLSKAIITTEGIHSIMLCDPAKTVNLDGIRKNIEQKLRIEKINNAANLLLNSIRQRALIEINSL